jgi:hypothetical protein
VLLRAHTRAVLLLGALFCGWQSPSLARADFALGGHLGVNLDHGNVHLGVDGLVPLAELSPRVQLGLWPSFAHVFIHEGHDVELLGVDLSFSFNALSRVATPFVAPGLGLSLGHESTVKLNVLGGVLFDLGPVKLFSSLALRFVRGTYVDLLAGALFEL